jgi:hypothetical protein
MCSGNPSIEIRSRNTSRVGTRGSRDDRGFVTGQSIQQTGLAGVWPPGNHHGQAITQQGTLARRFVEIGETLPQVVHAHPNARDRQENRSLPRKVDRGLHPHSQLEHTLGQLVDASRKFPAQRTQGGTRGWAEPLSIRSATLRPGQGRACR